MTDTAPRRAVLLAADGTPERVLAAPPARFLHLALRQLAQENPGRLVRAEWLHPTRGWVAFGHAIAAAPFPDWLHRPDKKHRRRR